MCGTCSWRSDDFVNASPDVIKVQLQVQESTVSFRQVGLSLVKGNHAIKSLYRGISPNLIGNAMSWGLYFMTYHDLVGQSKPTYWHALSAGVITSVITNPVWVLKTRMLSTNANDPGAYKNMAQGFKQIYTADGMRELERLCSEFI